MNKIPNRAAICEVLMEEAATDKDIVVLCSDSRGSASLAPFADAFPKQFVEVGIAEQNLVSISAGLAKCGKKPFAASPASFLSTRSYEQAKVDLAYSNTNVKLIGISGGVSYGALGMSHHSAQDIAAMSAIPNMRVYLPSDRHQTRKLTQALLQDQKPAYIRVGRNPVEDIYSAEDTPFAMDKATVFAPGGVNPAPFGSGQDALTAAGAGTEKGDVAVAMAGTAKDVAVAETSGASASEAFPYDVAIIACGEMVRPSVEASSLLLKDGIKAVVLDMYCVKPLDQEAVIRAAQQSKVLITVEEHSPFGGLGSMAAQTVCENCPKKLVNLALPDAPVITGTSKEVFDYYGLNAGGIAAKAKELLEK